MAFNREKQAEAVRQYNENLALEKQKLAEEQRQFNEQLALSKKKVSSGSGNSKKETSISDDSSGLSANAQKMLNTYLGIKSSGNKNIVSNALNKMIDTAGKAGARTFINNEYNKGTITANDVRIIANKLDL